MRSVLTYGQLNNEELTEELVLLTSALSAAYNDLAALLQDQQHDYLQVYARSPGNSVSAKNREAQYYVEELSRQIILKRAEINSASLARDLTILLLYRFKEGEVPFPTIADCDAEGCVVA